MVTSFAQNAEDVRLWRMFASKQTGFYVDVGAGHPVNNSVTKLFYDAGWHGLNVEPGRDFEILTAARPRDTTVDVAISVRSTRATTSVTSPYRELSSLAPPREHSFENLSVTEVTVRTARLDELVAEHAPDREIDFLKVDVEGGERDALESFDPRVLRPGVVVVEAISPHTKRPTHDDWEFLLLRAGYVFAAFDGINRFYIPEEHAELAPALAYPISPLDQYVHTDPSPVLPADDDLLRRSKSPTSEVRELQDALRDAAEALALTESTLSWRVTRPLRAVRRVQRKTLSETQRRASGASRREREHLERALASRLTQSVGLLAKQGGDLTVTADARSVSSALDDVRDVLQSNPVDVPAAAWLLLTAVDGSYPRERDVEQATQVLRTLGPAPFTRSLERRVSESFAAGGASRAEFDVLTDAVVVDVSQIVSSDLHTGIQRVARECTSHWLQAGLPLHLCWYDGDTGALRLLNDEEAYRLRHWQDHLENDGTGTRRPSASDNILVPSSCDLVLAELPTPDHSATLRALVVSRVHRTLCLVCYDLIPFVAPECVDPRIVTTFAQYLALLKHADRVSAISRQSADDLRAFASTLHGQGRRGPHIAAHPLPTQVPALQDPGLDSETTAPERHGPLVLVVGVHAPRKNHVAVLEAGERLWRRGLRFELVFMGGSMWRAEGYFDAYAERLQAVGMPVRVERRVSESRLWAAYRKARFTVFPSLIEGFGLPVAESLAAGTPVITSNYGSMAEIATGGGALTADPRDVDDLEENMRRLLEDDRLVERLREEARSRDLGRWADYARDVWEFFTAEPTTA